MIAAEGLSRQRENPSCCTIFPFCSHSEDVVSDQHGDDSALIPLLKFTTAQGPPNPRLIEVLRYYRELGHPFSCEGMAQGSITQFRSLIDHGLTGQRPR